MLECYSRYIHIQLWCIYGFGVSAGQVLGFIVHERGIKISQRSINAIKDIEPPANKTKVQSMVGKINFVR